ncbi:MAG: NAD(P)H-dependent oxidoreductase subunit E, partial [Oscillochloris sp.]|nr:NAD(P)H-dependent oxidoreductase subunit E [Oscillochloris sp.]
MLLDTHKSEIETIVSRYASKRSAVLPLLYIAQDTYGHLDDRAIREVAAILDLPATDVFAVVGFYTLFYNRPVGTWMLQVCDDVPCCYCGAEELIDALKQSLGIVEEQTTPDGMFTLQRVKCLAACDRPPVLQANLDYIYDATADRVDALLNDLRARAAAAKKRGVSGRAAEDFEFGAAGGLEEIRRFGAYRDRWAPAPAQVSEPQKAAVQEAQSAPAEPAQAEAEAQAEEQAPADAQHVDARYVDHGEHQGGRQTTPEGPAVEADQGIGEDQEDHQAEGRKPRHRGIGPDHAEYHLVDRQVAEHEEAEDPRFGHRIAGAAVERLLQEGDQQRHRQAGERGEAEKRRTTARGRPSAPKGW